MEIKLKRSNVLEAGKAKAPTAGQLEYGELAVNYNTNDPSLFLKDNNDNIVKLGLKPDGDFVNVTGDNMTGNLTLGTDKITLNATNGSADFAGGVDTADTNTSGVRIGGTGTITSQKETGSTGELYRGYLANAKTFNVVATGVVNLGTDVTSATTTNIILDGTDGSATFAGDVSTDNLKRFSAGSLSVSGTGGALCGYTGVTGVYGLWAYADSTSDNNSQNNAAINLFSGSGTKTPKFQVRPSGSVVISDIATTTDPKIKLNADGSAEFADNVQISIPTFSGPSDNSSQSTNLSLKASGPGVNTVTADLRLSRWSGVDAGAYTKLSFYLRDKIEGSDSFPEILSLHSNGRAKFEEGDVEIRNGDMKIGGDLPHDPNISLNNDGSAEFAGKVSTPAVGNVGSPALIEFATNGEFANYTRIYNGGTSANLGVIVTNNFGGTKSDSMLVANDGNVYIGGTLRGAVNSNIRLNGNDGSAEFAGDIETTSGEENSVKLTRTGAGLFYRKDTADTWTVLAASAGSVSDTGYQIISGGNYSGDNKVANFWVNSDGKAKFAGDISIGGTLPSAPNIELNADGSASFAGQVAVGVSQISPAGAIILPRVDSIFNIETSINRAYSTDKYVFVAEDLDTNDIKVGIKQDGNASFAGKVGIGTTNPSRTFEVHSTGPVIRLVDTDATGEPRAEIGAVDGNLTLGADQGASGTGGNIILYTQGNNERVRITSDGDTLIGGTLPSSPNISLNNDGTAEFAGDVSHSNFNLSSGTAGGWEFRSFGAVRVQRTAVSGGATNDVFSGYLGTEETSKILANGSAEFAGTVNIGKGTGTTANIGKLFCSMPSSVPIENADAHIVKYGTTTNYTVGFDGTTKIGGTLPSAPNIELNADGSASFAGYVAAEGLSNPGLPAGLDDSNFGTRIGITGNGDSVPGYFITSRDVGGSSDVAVFYGNQGDARIKGDGSAEFAGNLNILGAVSRVYADNTAAKAAGLVDGDVYRKADGTLMIAYS